MQRSDNDWAVGSALPKNLTYLSANDLDTYPLVRTYLEQQSWLNGVGLLILGDPGAGKTSLGATVLRNVYRTGTAAVTYWAEHDYLADLRNLWRLEDMTKSLPRDDALWMDYVNWERDLWAAKDSPVLFLDTVGRAYTPMQKYEIENLLRHRSDQSLPTIAAVDSVLYVSLSLAMQSLLTRSSLTVSVK